MYFKYSDIQLFLNVYLYIVYMSLELTIINSN